MPQAILGLTFKGYIFMPSKNQIKQLVNLNQWVDAIEHVFPNLLKPHLHHEDELLQIIRSMIDDLVRWAEQDCTWTAFTQHIHEQYGIEHITVCEPYKHLLMNDNAVPLLKVALAHVLLVQAKAKQYRPSFNLSELYDYGSKWMEVGLYMPLNMADQLAYIPIFNNKACPYRVEVIEFEGHDLHIRPIEYQDLASTHSHSNQLIFVRLRVSYSCHFDEFFKNKFSNYVLSYFELSEFEATTNNPKINFPSIDLKDLRPENFPNPVTPSHSVKITSQANTGLEKVITWVSKTENDFRVAELSSGEWKLPIKLSMLKENETIQDYFKRTAPQLPFTLDAANKLLDPNAVFTHSEAPTPLEG